MNPPDHSEDVAGVEEPTAADLEQMGVPSDTDDRIKAVRTRVHWKVVALAAQAELRVARDDLKMWRRTAHIIAAIAGIFAFLAGAR